MRTNVQPVPGELAARQGAKAACPVCASDVTEAFFVQRGVPAQQNVLVVSAEEARAVRRGDLVMTYCSGCGFVFNQAFNGVEYGPQYENTQSYSEAFNDYVDGLIGDLVVRHGIAGKRVVEVGCGKGGFLKKLISAAGGTTTGYGFDPSYLGDELEMDGRVRFEKAYYGPGSSHIHADVVICRHVIEHIADPLAMIANVRQALAGSPGAKVFFETPCVEWILANVVVWDFFYEHCSLFTASSLEYAFASSGFGVSKVEHIFGGQYLWIEAFVSDASSVVERSAGAVPALARRFADDEAILRTRWDSLLRDLASRRTVALWGAGAKGVTFANLVDPLAELIQCVADVNPNKQNCYIPGTGHPIVGPLELAARGVNCALLLNPNYRDEVETFLEKNGMDIEVMDLMERTR